MANKGDNDALYLLGLHYEFGVGTNKDDKKVFEILNKLAKIENQFTNYLSGDKKIIINKANDWYSRILRDTKLANVKIILGRNYMRGYGTEANYKKAIKLFKEAEKNGSSIAQYYLGYYYFANNNKAKSFEYYKKSADNGNIESQFQIGKCYYKGIGTEINKTKGIEIIKGLAEKGESCCPQNYLGELYELGSDIVNKDLKQAIYWYCKATENDCLIAAYNLGRCYENGNGVEKDERKAFEYYKNSANQDYLDAQFQLGYCYSKGIGTIIDKKKAIESYKKAANQGHNVAQYILAEIEFKDDLKTLIQRCSDIGKYFDAYSGEFQYNFEEIVNDLELLEVNEVQ
ncbi:unnamed protein product [Rhizophagus irregularis]|nr:unnamed protein product [Rhizophagus irregularis]